MNEKINKQIEYLKEKGFIISDEEKVKWYLIKVWLHRLRRYFNTVEEYNWTDFQEIINAYIFDKELRWLNLQVIEIIEKSLKSLLILNLDNYLDWKNYINTWWNFNIYKEKNKYRKRQIYIEKKIIDLKYNDIECFNFIEKNNFLSSEFFFDNLTFWEIINIFYDLTLEKQYIISKYYWIPLEIFKSWISGVLYLRNLSSHWKNIFNRKMTKSLKWRELINVFWNNNNSSYISYLFVLDLFSKKLIEEKKWINEIFKLMIKFNIKYEKFYLQKEIPHIEHEINSEAWEILVKELYKKYLYKSNLN